MQPEEARHLAQLQRSAAELGCLALDLAAATPPSVEGSDQTGLVHVVLGPDGIPTAIHVREGWQQRVDPARLASAVIDANGDAVQRAMQAWTVAMQENGWWRRQADFDADAVEGTAGAGQPLSESLFGHARDSNELAEEVLSKLQATQTQQAPPPAPDEGQDDGQHVTIQIASGGLNACTIEPDWARRHNGSSISAALSTALQRAVAKRSAQPSPRIELDALLGDALATLTSLTAIPPDQGGNR
jgi:hypothetical protein